MKPWNSEIPKWVTFKRGWIWQKRTKKYSWDFNRGTKSYICEKNVQIKELKEEYVDNYDNWRHNDNMNVKKKS